MKFRPGLLLLGIALSSKLNSNAAEIPEPVIPDGVGVNIHFVTGHLQDLDLIVAAGFRFIRMDFVWTETEKNKGRYDWTGYEELLGNLDKRGIRALFILDYSHHLYEDSVTSPHPLTGKTHTTTASPQHPESVAAYAKWAAAAAAHFKGRHIIWEIWNEPNGHFWAPKPDADQYTALALASAKAIRGTDPKATIIGPASSGFPWEFLETFLKSGVLQYLDAVSVHPYRDRRKEPETAKSDCERLRALIEKFAPAGKQKMPVLSGEWGYSSHTKGVSPEVQAAFAARQQLSNLLNGVPLSIWYDWKNDGDDPAENEHNFGTVSSDLTPKPAYAAIKTLTTELMGYRLERRIKLADEKDFVIVFKNSKGDEKLAAWTSGDLHSVEVAVDMKDSRTVKVVTDQGKSLNIEIRNKQLVLELKPGPQYVSY